MVKTLIHSGSKNILLHQLLQLIPLMPELPGQLDRVAGVVEEGHGRWHGVQSITGFIETVPITGVRWVHIALTLFPRNKRKIRFPTSFIHKLSPSTERTYIKSLTIIGQFMLVLCSHWLIEIAHRPSNPTWHQVCYLQRQDYCWQECVQGWAQEDPRLDLSSHIELLEEQGCVPSPLHHCWNYSLFLGWNICHKN